MGPCRFIADLPPTSELERGYPALHADDQIRPQGEGAPIAHE
jgi:hypothetical protein